MVAIRHLAVLVGDQIETKLSFGRLDAPVTVPGRHLEVAEFDLGIQRFTRRQIPQRLLENLDALAHLQHAHVVAVVDIADATHRHPKIEAIVNTILVDLANIVFHTTGPRHWSADTGVDGELLGEDTNMLAPSEKHLVPCE